MLSRKTDRLPGAGRIALSIAGLAAAFCFAAIPAAFAQDGAPGVVSAAPTDGLRFVPPIGHTGRITDVQVSPDGRLAASGGFDNAVLVWETATGRIVRRLPLAKRLEKLCFLPGANKRLVTAGNDKQLICWNLETGKPVWTITLPMYLSSLAPRPDGAAVVIGGSVSNVYTALAYRTDTGALLYKNGAGTGIAAQHADQFQFSPDGARLYGYSNDRTYWRAGAGGVRIPDVYAFDARTGKLLQTYMGTGWLIGCAPDGKRILTASPTGTTAWQIAWRDTQTGAPLNSVSQKREGDNWPIMALRPDGARFATLERGGPGRSRNEATIREYDGVSGALQHTTVINGVGEYPRLAYLPTGDVLATLGDSEHAVARVRPAQDSVVAVWRGGDRRVLIPAGLGANGLTVWVPGGTQTGMIGWNAVRRTTETLLFHPTDGKDSTPWWLRRAPAASQDGSLIAVPSRSGSQVFVCDGKSGKLLADIPTATGDLPNIAVHPQGAWVAVPVEKGLFHNTIRLMSPAGKLLHELTPPAPTGGSVVLRAVGLDTSGDRVLVSDFDGNLFVFNAQTGGLIKQLKPNTGIPGSPVAATTPPMVIPISAITALPGSPDRFLLANNAGFATEFDVATGKTVHVFTPDKPADRGPGGQTFAAISPNGAMVAVGSADGSIRLWSRGSTGTDAPILTATLTGHVGGVSALAFTPDNQRLTSLGGDATVRFWDVSRPGAAREAASLFVYTRPPSRLAALQLDSSDAEREQVLADIPQWIAFDRKGQFDGSADALSRVHFAEGTHIFGAEQFYERFFRPGLLATAVGGPIVPSPPDNVPDASEAIRTGTPPVVKLVVPNAGPSATIEVAVEATEQAKGGVKAIRLYHNGRLVGGPTALRGIVVEAVAGDTTTKKFMVSLAPGENALRAVAYSSTDLESEPALATLKWQAPQPPKPALHVLTVGINRYQDATMNLAYARPDAEALAGFFDKANQTSSLFSRVTVHQLTDTEATAAGITEQLTVLAAATKPEDVVFLYLAGHGETAEGGWYFLPHEMRQMALEERVKALGVPWQKIEAAVGKIPARKVVLVVDACKSGAALEGGLRGTGDEQKALAVMARAQGIHILTASTGQQYASEVKELGHGILTYALLEGLQGKASGTGAGGYISVRDLLSYVENRVPELTRQYRGSEQYPVPFERGQNFPLVDK